MNLIDFENNLRNKLCVRAEREREVDIFLT